MDSSHSGRRVSWKNFQQTLKNIFKVQRWESAGLQGPPEGGAEAAGGGEAEGGGGEGGAVPGAVGGAGQVRGLADSGGEPQHHPARPGQPGQGPVLPAGKLSDWRFQNFLSKPGGALAMTRSSTNAQIRHCLIVSLMRCRVNYLKLSS